MTTFKRGERVKVEFEHYDGTIKVYSGKFDSHVKVEGHPGLDCGIVRLSESASLMAQIHKIQKCVGRLAPGRNR